MCRAAVSARTMHVHVHVYTAQDSSLESADCVNVPYTFVHVHVSTH